MPTKIQFAWQIVVEHCKNAKFKCSEIPHSKIEKLKYVGACDSPLSMSVV